MLARAAGAGMGGLVGVGGVVGVGGMVGVGGSVGAQLIATALSNRTAATLLIHHQFLLVRLFFLLIIVPPFFVDVFRSVLKYQRSALASRNRFFLGFAETANIFGVFQAFQ